MSASSDSQNSLSQTQPQIDTAAQRHDTQEICDIYMSRPARLSHIGFGEFFVLAHSLHDPELRYCVNASDAKRIILRKNYVFLSLEPLREFNTLNSKEPSNGRIS